MNYANHYGYSDVNPYEVVRRVSDKTLEVREMKAERDPSYRPEFVPGGFSAVCVNQQDQRWIIISNPDAGITRIRLRRDGTWRRACGELFKLSDKPVKYYDYNF